MSSSTGQQLLAQRSIDLGPLGVVNRIGFGGMRICGAGCFGQPFDPEGARAAVRSAVEAGVGLIDTADCYGPNVSEEIIGEVVNALGSQVLIATKCGVEHPEPGVWRPNGRPEHLRSACDGSLRRLRRGVIDLYQLHAPDPDVPLEESIGALVELKNAGKIRSIGISNVGVDEIERACAVTEVISVQNRYGWHDRSCDQVVSECERRGIAFIPWRPVGMLDATMDRPPADIALRLGITVAQLLLVWLLNRSPVMLPIPGTSSAEHARENTLALDVVEILAPLDMAAMDRLAPEE